MNEMIHREIAKAKVNLSLRVLDKRDDGFHELVTRMAPISLADELEFYCADSYSLECDAEGVPLDETNLVTKAVRLFERERAKQCLWRVKLIKNVPHGAGLGGGSGDAAAVLRGLNKLEEAGLSEDRMAELLSEIGGELVKPVNWDHEVTMLLLKPFFVVNTPEAYKAWAGAVELPDVDYSGQQFKWGELVNDLEKPVFMKHRFLAEMKMWLVAQPEVEGAMMSGSGSTMMAVLKREDAEGVLARSREELDPTLWGVVVDLG